MVNFLVLRSELLDGPGLNENYDLIIDALFGFLVHAPVHSVTSVHSRSRQRTDQRVVVSVMRVGSDTFGDPIFQKGLQN